MSKRYGKDNKLMSHKKHICPVHGIRKRLDKDRMYVCRLCNSEDIPVVEEKEIEVIEEDKTNIEPEEE